ncbi:MAG: histidinol-phosphatase [Saccharospirillum sp.]
MTLAIFDLDNTLIAGDSDHAWGEFLIEQGLVDGDDFCHRNDRFYQDYLSGDLDVNAYLGFALSYLAGKPRDELDALHQRFMEEIIQPLLLPKATELLQQHRDQGHRLLIITATNAFVTGPIAAHLGVTDLIASEAEIRDGLYTGHPTGVPSFQHGKVTRLNAWLAQEQESMAGAWFYSDSHNDLPLLEQVDHPVAVDPDARLRQIAHDRQWPVISLRE